MKARDVMTPHPITVTPTATLAEVWDLMRDADIRHVPVTRDGILIGILSDRDLGAMDVGRVLTTEGAEALRVRLSTPIVSVMSADIISVGPETDLDEVIDLMIDSKVGAIPVTLPDTRELTGIISYVDVLRAVQEMVAEP